MIIKKSKKSAVNPSEQKTRTKIEIQCLRRQKELGTRLVFQKFLGFVAIHLKPFMQNRQTVFHPIGQISGHILVQSQRTNDPDKMVATFSAALLSIAR
jgi:hypothetical protein